MSEFLGALQLWSFEPPHDKTNKMVCAPSEDWDQPGHPPSLIRVFAVCIKKVWVLSYSLSTQRRLWTDWADVQADLSLRWAHSHFVGFFYETAHILFPQVVYMIRDDILPHAGSMPKDFVEKIMTILNKGSIHSTTSDSFIGINLLAKYFFPNFHWAW